MLPVLCCCAINIHKSCKWLKSGKLVLNDTHCHQMAHFGYTSRACVKN